MVTIEYRLYYDIDGNVITYTTENLPGNYIVITQNDYLLARPDIKVKDDKIVYRSRRRQNYKFEKNSEGNIKTSKYDISILVNDTETEYNTWGLVTYE